MPLKLLDLRTSGSSRLGVPTDAVRGRAQQAGRKFSQQIYDTTDFDGIVYASRITNAECVAIYDRAADAKLDAACPIKDVSELADLVSALTSLNIRLRACPNVSSGGTALSAAASHLTSAIRHGPTLHPDTDHRTI